MKAAYIRQHGTIDLLEVGEQDVPKVGPNDVLVEAKYAALNHLDIFVVAGWAGLSLQMPHILGSDGAGTVKEVGSAVTRIKPGDYVTVNPGISCNKCEFCLSGWQNFCAEFSILGEHQWGTFAQYFKVPEVSLLKLPPKFPLDKAAAAPLTFLTAWRMLVTRAEVKRGEIVFIHGAGGGVATAAIQIAKYLGATVITTTSTPEKTDKAKALGADHVVNYKEMPDFSKHVYADLTGRKGVDVVIDSVGAKTFTDSVRLLRAGGRLVTCGATTGPSGQVDIRNIFWKQLEIYGSTMSNQAEFRDVMKVVLSGAISPVIDRIFPLDQAKEAEKYLNQANQFGKVLLELK